MHVTMVQRRQQEILCHLQFSQDLLQPSVDLQDFLIKRAAASAAMLKMSQLALPFGKGVIET